MTIAPLTPDNTLRPKARYRAISVWAVASLVLGALSLTLALSWIFIVVPLAGIWAGWKGLRQIRRYQEEMIGMGFAQAGIALSLVFGLAGAAYLHFVVRDVPHGYVEIDFEDLQPDPRNPEEFVPPHALEFQPSPNRDRKIYIKGYIYPGKRTRDLHEFILVPTMGHCSFCFTKIRSTELIRVTLTGDLTTDYRSTEVGVGGRLRVDEEAARSPFGEVPYTLEADVIR